MTNDAKLGILGEGGELPKGWAVECVSKCEIIDPIQFTKDALVHVNLISDENTTYFGIQPSGYLHIEAGSTLCFETRVDLGKTRPMKCLHVLLREWVQGGEFCYQVKKSYRLSRERAEIASSVYLTQRDEGRVIQPLLLFEAEAAGAHSQTLSILTVKTRLV